MSYEQRPPFYTFRHPCFHKQVFHLFRLFQASQHKTNIFYKVPNNKAGNLDKAKVLSFPKRKLKHLLLNHWLYYSPIACTYSGFIMVPYKYMPQAGFDPLRAESGNCV